MKNKILNLFLAISMILSMAVTMNVTAAETEVTGGDNIDTATELSFDTDYISTIEGKDTKHYYKFTTLAEEAFYTIKYGNYTGSSKNFYLCTKAEKELKGSTYVNSDESSWNIKLDCNETYYLRIKNNYGEDSGNYGISISYAKDPVGDTAEDAMSVNINQKYDYELDGTDDKDFYSFIPAESKKHYITLANATGSTKHMKVADANEQEIAKKTYISTDKSAMAECDLVAGETYFVEVYGSSASGKYSIIVEDTKECEHKRTSKNNYVTEYEEIVGDENNHYIIKYYDKVCDECGEITEAKIQESKYRESHKFDGNYCSGCEFEKEEEPEEEPEYIPEDDEEDEPVYVPEDDDYEPIDGETSFGSEVSEWAEKEMEEAYDEGLIPEVLVGENLTETIDRAEFAAIAVKLYETLADESIDASSYCPFKDIYGNSCYTEIIKAYSLGITAGTTDTTFDPYSMITREQLATMLYRTVKRSIHTDWTLENDSKIYFPSGDNVPRFADDADISDYAKPAVYYMASIGAIKGVDSTHFAPKNTTSYHEAIGYAMATREQAIAISLRILNH